MDSPRSAVRELDRREPAAIGREARLALAFEYRGGRTILARYYAEPPFRVGRTFDLRGACYAVIVCSGPGVFAGDLLHQTVHVGRGARVVLTSQAALQVHPAPAPPAPCAATAAILRSRFVVEDQAELHCHWDPVILFAGARLDQRFDIRIGSGSALYWSDAIMAGRVSRGEAWRFDALGHELALRAEGSLVYLERYELRPTERDVRRAWSAGAARYLATSLVRHPKASTEIAERWHRALTSAHDGVGAAVDCVAPQLIAARLASADGAPFSRFRASYRAAALDEIFRAPELAGRK